MLHRTQLALDCSRRWKARRADLIYTVDLNPRHACPERPIDPAMTQFSHQTRPAWASSIQNFEVSLGRFAGRAIDRNDILRAGRAGND
jgi:hypothetical protein